MHSCHLSKGQRQFLGSKGISANEWDSMPIDKQNKWLKEMDSPEFITASNLKHRKFTINGNRVSEKHWTTDY